MAKVSGSLSTSLPVRVMALGVSSAVVTLWLFATGASFTGVTMMATVATALLVWPSLTRKVKLSPPLKLVAGVKVIAPVFVLKPLNVPLVGPVTMAKVSGSLSTSLPVRVIALGVSSGVVTLWPLATGASFTGVTMMATVATALLVWPSLTRKVKLSPPLKLVAGVKVIAPVFVLKPLNVPLVGPVTMAKVSGSLSTSLPVRVIALGVSSAVVTLWLFATGASFTGVTVMATVATALLVWPSLTRKVKLSPPLKLVAGV